MTDEFMGESAAKRCTDEHTSPRSLGVVENTGLSLPVLRERSTAAYEAHMASGLIVETHRDLLAQAISQQQETRRVWLELSKQLHEAEVAQ